jgi:GTP-binding protein
LIPVPKIALVGRPNVGKSTLFNRICGRRQAITDGRPGSTRDRNYAQASWGGAAFELIDTGGLLLATDDPLLGSATAQARLAIDEADLVLLVLDARAGLLPDDEAISRELRHRGKTVLVVANKTEANDDVPDFARLGFDTTFCVSAEHGIGIGDLLDAALALVPRVVATDEPNPPLRLAIVGRPNVGKSSLLNRLLGKDRAVVSAIPGTTRDALDAIVESDGRRFCFVDTAGIRKVRLLKDDVDHVSVLQARRAIERADVVLMVLDAEEGLREMDATIAGYVQESNRGVVLVANKWDMAPSKGLSVRSFEELVRDKLKFLAWAPLLRVSALAGRGLGQVFATAVRVEEARRTRVTTGEFNRLLAEATARNSPKADRGAQSLKIMYGTQVGIAPPTFMLAISHDVGLHFSYRRYLENQIRSAFGFEGTPLVFRLRKRRRAH